MHVEQAFFQLVVRWRFIGGNIAYKLTLNVLIIQCVMILIKYCKNADETDVRDFTTEN